MPRLRTIQFEDSTFCNANCIFCPRSDMTRKQGRMTDEMFYKIIKEGKEMGVRRFFPFLNGEPLMNPKLFEWLDYMEKEGVATCLFTNATLLDKEKTDKLIKYKNIQYINCSLNAATKETYDKVVRAPDFYKTSENIKYLISRSPFRIRVGITVVKENMHEIELFRKQWGGRAKISNFLNWAGRRHNETEKTGKKVPCRQFLNKLSILWDGRVCLCCMDYDGKVIFGDMNKESLKDIWKKAEATRDKHMQLDFDLPLCRNCNVNAQKTEFVYTRELNSSPNRIET